MSKPYSIKQNHPIFKSWSTVVLNGITYTLPSAPYNQLDYMVKRHLEGYEQLETLEHQINDIN